MKITFLTITLISVFYIISVQSERVYTRRHRKRLHVIDKVSTNVQEVHEVFRTALRPPSFTSSEVAIERFLKCDAMCYLRKQARKERLRTTASPNISTPRTTTTPTKAQSTTQRTTTPAITTTPRATLPTNPYANINPDYTHISEWNHGPSITATKYPAVKDKNINIHILEVENLTNMPTITAEKPQDLPTATIPTPTDAYSTTSWPLTTPGQANTVLFISTTEMPSTTEKPSTSSELTTSDTPISTETFTTISDPTTTVYVTSTSVLPTTTINSTFESSTSWYVEKKFIKEVPFTPVETDLDGGVNITTTDPAQVFEFDPSITEEPTIISTTVTPVEYEFGTNTAEGEDTDGIYYDGQYEDQDDDYDPNAENSENDY